MMLKRYYAIAFWGRILCYRFGRGQISADVKQKAEPLLKQMVTGRVRKSYAGGRTQSLHAGDWRRSFSWGRFAASTANLSRCWSPSHHRSFKRMSRDEEPT
jgi:hypothetical protein